MLGNVFCNGRVLMVLMITLLLSRISCLLEAGQLNLKALIFFGFHLKNLYPRVAKRISSLCSTLSSTIYSVGASDDPSQWLFAHRQ